MKKIFTWISKLLTKSGRKLIVSRMKKKMSASLWFIGDTSTKTPKL